jgi:hypothetical protein
MDDDELVRKFRSCVKFGTPEMPREETDRLIDTLMNLETIQNISELTRSLRFNVTKN